MTERSTNTNTESVLLTRDGAVANLTLNRQAALNALDLPMMDALVAHVATIAADPTLRVVVLQGAGKHFMAGGDLKTFATRLDAEPAQRQADFQLIVDRLHAAIEHVQRMPQVVICALRGAVAGFGLSLAATVTVHCVPLQIAPGISVSVGGICTQPACGSSRTM